MTVRLLLIQNVNQIFIWSTIYTFVLMSLLFWILKALVQMYKVDQLELLIQYESRFYCCYCRGLTQQLLQKLTVPKCSVS